MSRLGKQFGGKEGVPRSKEALAALGVGESREKSVESREGNSDEIGLSAAEQIEVKEAEGVWSRERMIAWAKSLGYDETYNEAWVDEIFEFLPDGTIRSKVNELYLSYTQVKEIPPGLQVEVLYLSFTQIKEIPPGLQVKKLWLSNTQVKEIPPGLQVNTLDLSNTQVKEIPPGLQVKVLNLSYTQVQEIPEDKGAIQTIRVNSSQTELKASAEARGIKVQTI